MDSLAITERSKLFRSRRNSAASDISEVTEIDVVVTPTKRTKSLATSDTLNKSNSRASKRLTRAGSEAKSPPTTRITRRTRASSMGPEATPDKKFTEMNQTEVDTPIKTKRRASILPLEATVLEETEEIIKNPMVTLERTLPNVQELENEIGIENSSKKQAHKILSVSLEKLNYDNLDKKRDDVCVEEVHDNSAENSSSTSEVVKMDVPDDNKKQMSTDNENVLGQSESVVEQRENLSTDTVIEAESLEHNVSEVLSQSMNSDTSKEPELEVENVLNNSIKEEIKDLNNKENHATNIISDSQSKDDIISNVLLQSPKPLSVSNINASKLTKEKCKSPNIETAIYRQSKESSELTSDIVSVKETSNNSDATNNSTNTSIITLIKEQDPDTSDNMQKLVLSTDTESLSEAPLSETANKNTVYIEMCEDSSFDESIQIVECTENISKTDNEKSIEIDNQPKESTEIFLDNQKCNEDANMMDVSSLHEENINKNEEFENDTTSQIMVTDDKCETIEGVAESDMSKNMETEVLNSTETLSSSDLNKVRSSKSSNECLIESKCSITSKNENTTNNLQNIEETNNLLACPNTTQESSDAHTSLEDSVSTDKSKKNVTNVVKSSHSSIVTEIPAESGEEVTEKELSQKTSILDDSLVTEKQSLHKSESSNEQKKAKVNLETCKKSSESIEVDDIDSDTNTANLFQDIPAEEWKEKNNDVDQISVRSSMSTEILDNESETECDLILVDREAWLAAENIKMEKEKETFDYDSDDTVLLKVRKDSLKTHGNEKTANVLKDDCKMNVSGSKTSNTNKRKSMQQEETADSEHGMEGLEDAEDNMTQDTEEVIDIGNMSKRKSIIKVTKEQNTAKSNTSIQKSMEEKSISESHETTETNENLNKLSADSPLNKSKLSEDFPKKRKSLNKSIQEMGNESEKSNEMETTKKKKSLNKSKSIEREMIESDSNDEDAYTISKKNKKKQSLHDSSKKKIIQKQADVNLSEESGNESKESEVFEKKNSGRKRKFSRNHSTVVNIDSDSDVSIQNLDSDDSQNESMKLPKFLFGGGSDDDSDDDDNKSNKSIDSDIQREYNLHGEDISKFSDDDVPGDECRASETESSDPDDNGSDLIDFVVDDDEVEEEEVEEEENEELDNDEDPEGNKKQDKEVLEEQDEEAVDEQDVEISEEQDEEALAERDVEAFEEQDEETLEERNEEMEQEMVEIEDEVQEKVTEEDNNSNKDGQEIIDDENANKSMDNSNKEKNKPRKSVDTSLSKTIENGKKEKKKSKMDMSQIETDEHFSSYSPLSNSCKTKKTKLKRVSNEFSDSTDQVLNESQLYVQKMHEHSKTLECSTPKSGSLKKEKFNTSLGTTCVTLSNKTCEIEEGNYSNKEKVENRTPGMENSSKKLSKEKSKDNFMCRSFPSELIESIEKTNLSRPMSSKVADLNKTVLTPNIESPTIKYLKKEKLNESAPELKFDNKCIKSINSSINNEQSRTLSSFEKVNVHIEESNVKASQEVNASLRKKLLKVADTILETDQKKRKKRKQPIVAKTNFTLFDEDNSKENKDSQIMEKTETRVISIPNIDENDEAEILSNEKTQKRKKKKTIRVEKPLKEDTCEDFNEIKAEINDRPIYNESKKKKKRQKIIEDVTECTNINLESKVSTKKKGKNEKKVLLPSAQISAEELQNKKSKLFKDIASEGEQILIEKLPKKKKKSLNDIELQDVQISTEKLSKKKQKLIKDVASEDEQILIEKFPKKKKLSNDTASHDILISTEKSPSKKQKLLKDNASEGENVFIEKLPKKKKKLLNNIASQDVQFSAEKLHKKKQKLIKDVASEGEQILIKKLPKKKKKLSNDNASQNVAISADKLSKNKQKILSKDLQCAEASLEKLPKKMQKLLSQKISQDKGRLSKTSNKSHQLSDAELDSDKGPEVVAFSKSRDKALEVLKHTIDNIKVNKELKKKQRREHIEKMQEGKEIEIQKPEFKTQYRIKRLPDEVLENLPDVPLKQVKRRKLIKSQEQVLPTRSMFDSKVKESKSVDEENFIPLSSYGGTTQFSVVNLQKFKKKKEVSEVVAFRQKILAKNPRQPVSAYLMYLEKQKTSTKTKFYNKPY
ncbi:uncharacterized protein LOC143148252 isoform X2 [Ptiloglossa arizonensis]